MAGDNFILHYQHGRLAYFNVSVLSLLIYPVAADAAGEVDKDTKHLVAMENVGGGFIPLVVESFGVWTPFAVSMLRSLLIVLVEFHLKWLGPTTFSVFMGRKFEDDIAILGAIRF